MRGAGLGTGDEQSDGHVDGSAVHGVPTGHAGLVLDDDDGSLGNGVGLGMRDGEALHHARGALGLAGQEGVHHGVGVAGDTGLDGLVGNEAQGLVTRSEVLGDKDILDLHEVGSLGLGGLDGSGLGGLNGLGCRSGLLVLLEVVLLEGHEQDATDHSADEDREDPKRTVLDNGQDQEATVRRRIVDVEHNGQNRSDRGTEHHDGHDRPDVLGHERNGALGDVGATKDEVDDTGVVILLAEVLLADNDGEGGDQRRNDAGGGDGSHEVGAEVVGIGANTGGQSLGEHSGTGDISSLIDRATHVKGAHAADSKTQDNGARGGQALEEVHHGGVDGSHGTGNAEHDQADDSRREQRVQEDSLEAVQVLGQTGKDLLEQQDDITGEEATDDAAQEAEAHAGATGVDHAGLGVNRQALDGDHTGNKTGDERRALADGFGDVGGKHRNHKVHGDAADDLEHRSKAVVVRRRRIEGRNAPQERDSGQNTTSNNEDQHVADAVHEVLVDDVADGLLLLDLILDISSSCNRVVTLGGERAVNQLTGGLNGQGLGNTNGNHGLAGETLSLDILVGCDDDGLGTSDLTLGELVLDTDLAMSLDLDGQTALGSCLLQRLLRHEGVRNAGRATGRGDDVKLSHVSLLLEYSARGRSPTRASMRVFPQLKDTNLPSA